MHNVQCAVTKEQWHCSVCRLVGVHSAQCTVHSVQCTVYTAESTNGRGLGAQPTVEAGKPLALIGLAPPYSYCQVDMQMESWTQTVSFGEIHIYKGAIEGEN